MDATGWGFPAEELPKGDFTLLWDSTTEVPFKGFYTADGEKNTITVNAQVISVPPGSYRGLWLLVASTHGDTIGGELILNYRDGSQDVYQVSATDWCLGNPIGGEKMLIKPPYRMDQNGRDNLSCGMWLMEEYQVNPDLILESTVLPKIRLVIRNSTFLASPCVSNPKRKLNRSHYEEAALRRVASFHCCALYHLFAPYTALFHFVWERLCVASNLRYGTVLLCVDAAHQARVSLPSHSALFRSVWGGGRLVLLYLKNTNYD